MLLGVKEMEKKSNRSRSKRTLKGLPLGLVVLLVAGIVTTAALMTFYVKIENENVIDQLFEIKDNSTGTYTAYADAEETIITFDTTDLVGGDSIDWDFSLKLNSDVDTDKTMTFLVTDFVEDGVNVTITQNDVEVSDYQFTPGEETEFNFNLEIDVYTFSDTYTCMVTMVSV